MIRYNMDLCGDPVALVAAFAHELAHYLLFQAVSDPPLGWEAGEYLTDLSAVIMGFGVFLANSSFTFSQWQNHALQGWETRRQGYLGELDLAYGLALFCLLKKCDPKSIIRHLRPNPRSYFKTALKHLHKTYRSELDALRLVEALPMRDTSDVNQTVL